MPGSKKATSSPCLAVQSKRVIGLSRKKATFPFPTGEQVMDCQLLVSTQHSVLSQAPNLSLDGGGGDGDEIWDSHCRVQFRPMSTNIGQGVQSSCGKAGKLWVKSKDLVKIRSIKGGILKSQFINVKGGKREVNSLPSEIKACWRRVLWCSKCNISVNKLCQQRKLGSL